MCGIAGIISRPKEVDFAHLLSGMLNVLKHRGPDHTEVVSLNNKAHLGFNRLSIVDLSKNGNQPLFNEARTLVLVLNGEIYNYTELRKELALLGHRFSSETDAETVIHAYEEWREGCVERLRGMFAFTIWNTKDDTLFLARDRLGIKPLYYFQYDGCFMFASELKAFTALPKQFRPVDLNKDMLGVYFSFPFINDNINTFLNNVHKLAPGHFAFFKEGNFKATRYWDLEKKYHHKLTFEQAKEETERILKESIKCHLIGDVPIALMLTGGLDSSVMLVLALQCNKKIDFAITAGHSDFIFDERKYGKFVAKHLGVKHIELEINPSEVAEKMEEMVWYFDDLSAIGFFYQILMAKKIKEFGLKVVLTGEGSDEIFGGYHIFKMSTFPFSILPEQVWNMLYYKILSGRRFNKDYFKYSRLIKKKIFSSGIDVHNLCSLFEVQSQLPNYILMAVDKGYMSSSVEARVPYLDHKLVEWVYSLPQAYKLKGFFFSRKHEVIKHILRAICSKYLPAEISMRRKQGLGLSMLEVIRSNEVKVRNYLLSTNSMARTLFDKKTIELALNDKARNMFFLSRLYILEIWSKQYLS